jgi:hypothetical protein
VNENAAVGTVVGVTANASDVDATNNVISYSLANDDGGRFAIDSTTGVLTVAGAIDRESDGATRTITVRATSTDGSYTDQVFTIAINDVDEFDVGAVVDTNASSNNVNENAAVGTVVGVTANASDVDATNNTISYSLVNNDSGRFAIDSTTGVVTVAGAINRESDGAIRTITVRATSTDGSHADQIFTIAINDVDEFDVGAVVDTNATSNHVNENAAVGTLVGITANASDADATNNVISYSLANDDSGRFAIDSTTGVVTVAGAIDREADGAIRSITVRATSTDGSYTDQVFAIAINDVDEFDVTISIDANPNPNAIFENTFGVVPVGITASAIDGDATTNGVTYSLDDSASGRFAIDSVTGIVSQTGPLDYEFYTSHSIVVRATSQDGSYSTAAFTIQVLNNNEAPVAVNDSITIQENDVATISVLANDYDQDPNDLISIRTAQISQGFGQVQIVGGNLIYQAGTAYDYLSVGETAAVVIGYQIEDSFGLVANASVSVTIEGNRDQLYVEIVNIQGTEDTVFTWPVAVTKIDTNGETCTDVVVRGLPVGTIVSDVNGATRVADQSGTVSVFGMSLGSLRYRVPSNLSGTILANVDVYTSHGPAYTQTFQRVIEIAAVADMGQITGIGGRISAGQTLALPLGYSLSDTDGSEVASLHVRGIPTGMRITDGVQSHVSTNPLDWVELTNWNIPGLKLDSQGGVWGAYSFTYRLTTTELSNGSAASVETTVKIDVDAVLPPVVEQQVQARVEVLRVSEPSDRVTVESGATEPNSEPTQMTSPDSSATTSDIAPQSVDVMAIDISTVEFSQDLELAREFESLQQSAPSSFALVAKLDSSTQTFEVQEEQAGSATMAEVTQIAASSVDTEYRDVEETSAVIQEQLREQSEIDQETQRNVSMQSRVVAFWNMLRGGVLSQDSAVRQDARVETRSGQRGGKQE